MNINNTTSQDYWFGPLHLLPNASGYVVDDTTETSLYLTDDAVADAINNLSAAGKDHGFWGRVAVSAADWDAAGRAR